MSSFREAVTQYWEVNEHIKGFFDYIGPYEGLTFDDVSLRTNWSEITPEDADVQTYFTRNVPLNIPLTSAAMDTVTEKEMAIALACLGGIGVIHKALDPEEQARQVGTVKKYLNAVIESPVTFHESETVGDIYDAGLKFSRFPIVNESLRLVGILTRHDLKFIKDRSLRIGDIMTKDNLITGDLETSIEDAERIMSDAKISTLPIIDSEGILKRLYVWDDVNRIVNGDQQLYNVDDNGQLRVAAAVGPKDRERIDALVKQNVDVIVIDTAHGFSANVVDAIVWTKENYDIDVMAGNVSEGPAAEALMDPTDYAEKAVESGADGVKIGQGPGAICTTRVVAGVGVPQLTAVYEAAYAVKGKIPVCADGGISRSGHVVKALAAGAQSVMMGSMLAGTDESPSKLVRFDGRLWKEYRGMGSLGAMRDSQASMERYGQKDASKLVPEGIEGRTPYIGPLSDTVTQLVGGLQSGMGYLGAENLRELHQKARFLKQSAAGQAESHPHDVVITEESPNYSAIEQRRK